MLVDLLGCCWSGQVWEYCDMCQLSARRQQYPELAGKVVRAAAEVQQAPDQGADGADLCAELSASRLQQSVSLQNPATSSSKADPTSRLAPVLTGSCAQLLKYSENLTKGRAGQILNMDNFIDTSNIEGRFEFSEWVRAYGKYLDEQLDVYSRISFYQVPCDEHACSCCRSYLLCTAKQHTRTASTLTSSWTCTPASPSTRCLLLDCMETCLLANRAGTSERTAVADAQDRRAAKQHMLTASISMSSWTCTAASPSTSCQGWRADAAGAGMTGARPVEQQAWCHKHVSAPNLPQL